MTVETWLAAAVADAKRRGLPELEPLLETLARSTAALRAVDTAFREPAPLPQAGPLAAGEPPHKPPQDGPLAANRPPHEGNK
jgi:hypothetical protein